MGITAEEALGASISYTNKKVSQSAGLHREIVQSLPVTGDEHIIYMVPKTGSGTNNYDEYMWINNAYELIGNTEVDLTDYYNKTQVDTALNGKANTATSLSGYGITDAYTKTETDTALGNKAGSLVTQNFSNTSELTVEANNYNAISIDITKQGYTPIAIVKIWAMPQGMLPIGGFYIYNNEGTDYAVVRYMNPTNSSQSCSKRSLEFTVLYSKN